MIRKTASRKSGAYRPQPRRLLPVAKQEGVIVGIAAELFLERGFNGVSIDAITSIAGGSKRDLYSLFKDKETLFERCIAALVTERTETLGDISPTENIRDCLRSVGLQIVDLFLEPRTLALHRLIVSDADKTRAAARSFFIGGPQRVYKAVGELLDYYRSTGRIDVLDAVASAKIFVGGLTSELQIRALSGQCIDAPERRAKVDLAVDHFLKGCRAEDPGSHPDDR